MSLTATRLQTEEKDEKRRKLLSVLLTSFLVALLLVLLIFFGFKYLDPPPPEEGVEISMGQEFGGRIQETPQQTAAQKASSAPKTEESYQTQDFEDAPDANNTPSQNNPTPTNTPTNTKDPEPNKTVNSNWQFESGNDNTNNGDDNADGNKGKDDGKGKDPLGGYGLGNKGTGSFLSGRKPQNTISASCKFGRSEIIIVKIKVNSQGYVTYTDCVMKYNFKGTMLKATTIGNPYCSCAKEAAKKVRFSAKANEPSQTGAIKFDYKVK